MDQKLQGYIDKLNKLNFQKLEVTHINRELILMKKL